MLKRFLGKTGIQVSELCFGALPMGPLQKNLDGDYCASLASYALRNGINFIDTAEMYKTYEPIQKAMKETGIRPVIASKSNKKTYKDMENAVNEALTKLDIDYIDIFHLHAARERENVFELYSESLSCLMDLKAQGKIRAVGISTHSAAVASMAAEKDDIDVVFPIINISGLGIIDGNRDDMEKAIKKISLSGKGVYLMKALAGGGLLTKYSEAMEYARGIEGSASIALGMTSLEEVEYNIRYFDGHNVNTLPETSSMKKALIFKAICKGCGKCISACPNKAIIIDEENKANIDINMCLTCGYCTPVCPEFAIRVV